MIFTIIKRIVKFGFINFWRNKWLSLGSALVLTLTLITISISTIQNYDIKRTTETIKDKLDIVVYFEEGVTEEEIKDIQLKLQARSDVKLVNYISKNDALRVWQDLPSSQKIKDLVSTDSNPLPRSIQIKTYETESIETITQIFAGENYKDKVRRISSEDNRKFIQDLISRNKVVTKNGIVSSTTFIIISLIVIINTFRIIILTKKNEIEIMRLVGASDMTIRAPFIVESSIIGLLAALLSTGFLYISVEYNVQLIPLFVSQYFSGVSVSIQDIVLQNIAVIFVVQLIFAFIITLTTSLMSLRKYLKT